MDCGVSDGHAAFNSCEALVEAVFKVSSATCCFWSGFTAASTLYDGAMSTFGTTKTSFATGVSSWAPTGGTATKAYRITYALSASTPDSAQGGTAALGFTWESQNS